MSENSKIAVLTQVQPLTRSNRKPPRVEDYPKIWALMEEGNSLKDACAALDIHYATVRHRISADPLLTNEFMVANALQAESYAMRAIEIAEDLVDPDSTSGIKPANAKAAIPVFQWAAAQLAPQDWGKSRVEVTGKDGKDIAGTNVIVFELPKNGR